MEQKFNQFKDLFLNTLWDTKDHTNLNQCSLDHLFDLCYNIDMKKFIIRSKKHGLFEVLLDDGDYETIKSMGKWNIHMVRGIPYVQKRIRMRELVQMYRFLVGAKKGEYVDHINGNTLDNTRANLRICTNAANLRNGKIRPNNKSGFTGVFHTKYNTWTSYIKVNYKRIHLGSFKTFEEAVKSRQEANKLYYSI